MLRRFRKLPVSLSGGFAGRDSVIGREFGHDVDERRKFKVPSLRNIALAYPYLHELR